MRIALDYDDTFTEDPTFWAEVVALAKKRGHSVTFVTFRHENSSNPHHTNDDIREDAEILDLEIVYCGLKQKATKFEADVWIDDSPHFIPSADNLKKHCEEFDVDHQLAHPITEQFDTKFGETYYGKVHADGNVELFSPDGTPCPKKKLDRFGYHK